MCIWGQKGKRGHLGPKSPILRKFQNYYFQLMCHVNSLPKWSQPPRNAYPISNSAHLCVFGVKRERGVIRTPWPQFWENFKNIIFRGCALLMHFRNGLHRVRILFSSEDMIFFNENVLTPDFPILSHLLGCYSLLCCPKNTNFSLCLK